MTSLEKVLRALKQGEIIAYPTEGVWGLGCDPKNNKAILKLLSLKGRSSKKGLILIGAKPEHFYDYVDFDLYKERLLQKWPGAHTWVVPSKTQNSLLTGETKNIALRMSSHPKIIQLCNEFNGALVSTSANKEGEPTLLTLGSIKKQFPSVEPLKGDLGGMTKPSGIQDLLTGRIIRA